MTYEEINEILNAEDRKYRNQMLRNMMINYRYVKDILYENERYILYKNHTGNFTFGSKCKFFSAWGFPVNQSCLTLEECISNLESWIDLDEKNNNVYNVETWKRMINIL